MNLNRPRLQLGLNLDLSTRPELFGRVLLLKGLYIYGRALSEESKQLGELEVETVIYNETDPAKVIPPENGAVFRLRDQQEFPYLCAIIIPPLH
ncbi:MAG: hypothetical protein GC154_17750 [bacterium]|nr:hypothetical protein [bacterium]